MANKNNKKSLARRNRNGQKKTASRPGSQSGRVSHLNAPQSHLPAEDPIITVEQWYEERFEPTIKFLRTRNLADPENLVQTSAVKAHATFSATRGRPFVSWLWLILQNLMFDEMRKRYRRGPHVPLEDADHLQIAVEADPSSDDRLACLGAVLRTLPSKTVELLLLHYGDKTPIKQLAARRGLSEGAVKMRLMRARCELTRLLHAARCYCVDDAEKLGELLLRRPVLLPSSPPALPQLRPSCNPPC